MQFYLELMWMMLRRGWKFTFVSGMFGCHRSSFYLERCALCRMYLFECSKVLGDVSVSYFVDFIDSLHLYMVPVY
jgi:hypothetical protein